MENKTSPIECRSFAAGAIASTIILTIISLLLIFFLATRVGFGNLYLKIKHAVLPHTEYEMLAKKKLDLPEDILEELVRLHAVIDNANNPTHSKRHDTILVRPDNKLGYVLNKNADIDAYVLKTGEEFNLDPPVLYINAGLTFSTALDGYIKNHSRLHYKYTTTSDGYRNTVPLINSEAKILFVGDSVAFGVGVDDTSTAASNLQSLVGQSYSVINTGVGGYSAKQALNLAASLSAETSYDYLVYLTSQNDFQSGDKYTEDGVKNILKNFSSLKKSFSRGVIVAVFPYMEYSISDVVLEAGYKTERISRLDRIYSDLSEYSKEFGLVYIDLKEMVDSYTKVSGSIFSRFSLYADHAHMSPVANRMVAEKIYAHLENLDLNTSTQGVAEIAE